MANSTVIDDAREPLRLPAFEKAVMFAVTQALEKWRDEAMEGATLGSLISPLPLQACAYSYVSA